jgi:hypothetical protein
MFRAHRTAPSAMNLSRDGADRKRQVNILWCARGSAFQQRRCLAGCHCTAKLGSPAPASRRRAHGYEAKEPSPNHIALTQGERSRVVPHGAPPQWWCGIERGSYQLRQARSARPDAILDSRWRRFIRDVDQLIFLIGSLSDAGAYFTDAGVIDDVEIADGLVVRMSAPAP